MAPLAPPPIIQTARLTLRPLSQDDAPALYPIRTNIEVMSWM